jgi:DNA-directed RNA polymerase specialized sigma24 family protein
MKAIPDLPVTDDERPAHGQPTDDLLRAILAVLVDEREQQAKNRQEQMKSELLLANAGLTFATIAQVMGKKPDAVRMMLSRARRPTPEASLGQRSKAKVEPTESGDARKL